MSLRGGLPSQRAILLDPEDDEMFEAEVLAALASELGPTDADVRGLDTTAFGDLARQRRGRSPLP